MDLSFVVLILRFAWGKLIIGKLILTDLEGAFSGRDVFFAESSLLVQTFSVLLDNQSMICIQATRL